MIDIPICYYRDYAGAYDYGYETLGLPLDECALLVVDVDGTSPNPTTEGMIAPALHAARASGMRVAYVHNDLRLVANPGNIVGEVWAALLGISGDALVGWRNNASFEPEYLDRTTAGGRAQSPQGIWSGFHDTFRSKLPAQLRYGRTLFAVGYSRRACLHYTCAEAVGRNYRVILLRDCSNAPGEIEMPDTRDDSLPEGGWIQRITLRNFEHSIGYTTTRDEFVAACEGAD